MKEGAVRHAGPRQPGAGRAAARPGPAGHRRALAVLRADGRHRADRSADRMEPEVSPMSVDLRTRYLGLELKNPLVVSAGPLTGPDRHALTAGGGRGRRGRVLPSLFEEQIEHDQMEVLRASTRTSATASPRPSPTFPRWRTTTPGRTTTSGSSRQAKSAADHPGHRQPERHLQRRLDPLRQDDPGGRRRRPGAEYLLTWPPTPTDRGRTSRTGTSSWWQAVRASISIPLAVKIGPFFSSLPNMAKRLFGGRGRRPGPVQPLPPARHRPGDPDGRAPTSCSAPATSCACRCGGSPSSAAYSDKSLAATTRGPHRRGRAQAAAGRGRRRHDRLGPAQARPGPPRSSARRRPCLAGGEGIRLRRADEGSLSQGNSPNPAAFERANYIKSLTSFLGNAIWGLSDRDGGERQSRSRRFRRRQRRGQTYQQGVIDDDHHERRVAAMFFEARPHGSDSRGRVSRPRSQAVHDRGPPHRQEAAGRPVHHPAAARPWRADPAHDRRLRPGARHDHDHRPGDRQDDQAAEHAGGRRCDPRPGRAAGQALGRRALRHGRRDRRRRGGGDRLPDRQGHEARPATT